MKEIVIPILENNSNLKHTEDFYTAYSPEREDPGNQDFDTKRTPKIVSAPDENSLNLVKSFYQLFIEQVIAVSSMEVAEATKITENIFRAVNIAFVNELKVIYDRMGIDIWEVIDAAKTKPFGFMPFYPGPGIGGHCIPVDPFYLAWKAKQIGQKTEFIELAGAINVSMVDYILEKLEEGLASAIDGKKILVIGIAYKRNVADQRETPAFPLMKKLSSHGANIDFHDPYIKTILPSRQYSMFSGLASADLSEEMIHSYDGVIIITDHDNVDYQLIADHSKLIIDTRNALRARNLEPKNKLIAA